jgi:hypothetical protein
MKKSLSIIISIFLVSNVLVQAQVNTIQKPKIQMDRVTLEKNQMAIINDFRTKVNASLQQLESINRKSSASLKTSLSAKITSYINTTLKSRPIDKSVFSDPNKPYITEVYCPNPAGVKPMGEFLLIGANLLSTSGTSTVTVKLGQTSISCTPSYGNSTSEWLWVHINDFKGITSASPATVTVTSNNLTSDPAKITLLPELVTQRLDLTNFMNELKTDFKCTYPMVYVPTVTEATNHSFTVIYYDILWVNHSFPAQTNDATVSKGEDEFLLNAELKNNWKIKQIVFFDNRSICGTVADNQISAALRESGVNSSSLRVKVFWINFNELCNRSGYTITYILEGPKGTNYF